MNRNNLNTRLQFESLEQRQMMAGDVDARAIGSVLYITGDSLANGLLIHSTSEGVIELRGLDAGGAATEVNGKASESFVRIKDIFVTLEDGDDSLLITNLELSGSLTIRTGDDNDFIGLGEFDDDDDDLIEEILDSLTPGVLGAVTIEGAMAIDAADGNDHLVVGNASLNISTIVMGKGADQVDFVQEGDDEEDDDYIPGVTTTGLLTISLGDGVNSASFKGMNAHNLTLTAGNELDTISLRNTTVSKSTDIVAGDGGNTVTVEDFQGKSLGIALGVGNDTTTLTDVTTTSRTVIGDGFGDDTLTITNLTAKSLGTSMGVGNDTLTITNANIAKSLNLAAGEGDDTVNLVGIVGKSLDLWGDGGNDDLSLTNVAIVKAMKVSGGVGNDSIDIDGASASTLTIILGSGDDDLEMEHVIVGKKTTLDGGTGANTYTDGGSNTLPKLKSKNFQNVI